MLLAIPTRVLPNRTSPPKLLRTPRFLKLFLLCSKQDSTSLEDLVLCELSHGLVCSMSATVPYNDGCHPGIVVSVRPVKPAFWHVALGLCTPMLHRARNLLSVAKKAFTSIHRWLSCGFHCFRSGASILRSGPHCFRTPTILDRKPLPVSAK